MIMKRWIYALGLALLIVGCGVRKTERPLRGGRATAQERTELFRSLRNQREDWTAVRAKLQGTLQTRGGKELSARIQLQAARGKGIRLSVHYLLFEVARLWFTPTEVTFVDLVNGAYAQEAYPNFGERLGLKLDYSQIEAIIMGTVFVPGEELSDASLQGLSYAPLSKGEHQLSGDVMGLSYSFALSPEAVLRSLLVTTSRGERIFDAQYISPAQSSLPTLTTPMEAVYSIYSSSRTTADPKRGSLSLEWQSLVELESEEGLSLTPVIKEKYQRLDLGALLKLLK